MFPQMRTALLAGGLLARAVIRRGRRHDLHLGRAADAADLDLRDLSRSAQLPIVNVVALFVIVASIIPVYIAQRLAGGGGRDDDRAPTIPAAAP